MGYLPIVRELLKGGADVHAENEAALVSCMVPGHLEIIKVLLEAGADVNGRAGAPLADAVMFDHIEIVKLLLKAGADVNAQEGNALNLAVSFDYVHIARVLIDAGSHLPSLNRALVTAARNDCLDAVNLLIEAGADIFAEDCVALVEAAKYDHMATFNFLLETIMDQLAVDTTSETSYVHPVHSVKSLLKVYSSIRARDDCVLIPAATSGNIDDVKAILERSGVVTNPCSAAFITAAARGEGWKVRMFLDGWWEDVTGMAALGFKIAIGGGQMDVAIDLFFHVCELQGEGGGGGGVVSGDADTDGEGRD
ncbi:hypothetical protein HDV00_002762 [Rhizophlyctis rosea]|nr:hypothetical protein HDV00_002762 [Rhizophlyctis rosea]